MSTGTVQGTSGERHNIWQGILEWAEEAKNPTDAQKQTRHVPCQVSAYSKDKEPELKADTWPPKLIMQFIPRQLVGNIDGSYLKRSKSVIFHPTPCEALESLMKMMCSGFAGCIHFASAPVCEIKILILFYTAEKKTYLGFIPNDQTNFVDHLRKVIQQETISHASMRQELSCINQPVPTQVPQTVIASQQAPVLVSSITQEITHPQTQGTVSTGTVQRASRDRHYIWQGILEWIEKAKNPTDAQKQMRHVPCRVWVNLKNEEPELKADTWPPKLIMQLMPKQLIGNIGSSYLKHSKSVYFHPTPCEALESLTKMMNSGYAGCVHFTSAPACEIKILMLLYTEKKTYLGFIPNDQTNFVYHLRKVIEQKKISQASMRQGQANPETGNTILAPMPTTGTQGGILMSQTNTMIMRSGHIRYFL